MLSRLFIKNYALIDQLDIEFSGNLNIITGETGAGKSIIVGALSLILGQRADSKSLYKQTEKCVIEGYFDLSNYDLKDFFNNANIDWQQETIFRREISVDGKSRSFINDTPVSLAVLKELGEQLVDIHSQHETTELNSEIFQLAIVDGFCQHDDLLSGYKQILKEYKKLNAQLEELRTQSTSGKNEFDYLRFQIDELEAAQLNVEEQAKLETEQRELSHAEEIKKNLYTTLHLLQESESSVNKQLKESLIALQSVAKFSDNITALAERLNSSYIELKDIAVEIEQLANSIAIDGQRLMDVQERLDLLYKLQQKHRAANTEELLTLLQEWIKKLDAYSNMDEYLVKLEKELKEHKSKLISHTTQLSTNRNALIPEIEQQLSELLGEVGMPHATVKIINKATDVEAFGANGIDKLSFLFSANKGYPLVELNKVASGGELSRLMLCIKGLAAKYTAMPTIIFDEIDSGVSGEVALKVGLVMEKLASSLQVITITHLPQIASKGRSHYFVYKQLKGELTHTGIRQLSEQERIVEIAKMLSGENPTEVAMANARELLAN